MMFADVFSQSYMVRYLFAVISVVLAWFLTSQSVKSLRRDLIYRVRPIPGFRLTSTFSLADGGDGTPIKLPLYHTTCIGRSSACDIRIRRSDLASRHIMIYYYDSSWFAKPVSRRWPVYLNDVRIMLATPLEPKDIISIGTLDLLFSDDKTDMSMYEQISYGNFDDSFDDEESVTKSLSVSGSVPAWILINLYILLGGWLITRMIPEGMPALSSLLPFFILATMLLLNLYYLLLPVILRGLDRFLIIIMILLTAIGIFMQIRLSGMLSSGVLRAASEAATGDQQASVQLTEFSQIILEGLKSQGISIILGLALLPFIVIIVARTRILEPLAVICAILTPALLIVTLIFGYGSDQHGATLWISIGGMSIQLTEFAKITYIIVLASFFKVRPSKRIQLMFSLWAAVIFLLIMLLPDLGMVMILLPVTLVVYVVMTSEYLTAFFILISGIAVSIAAYSFFPHVQRRLAGWTTLWQEVNDSNRQIVYGLQAVGRGGLLGRGLGNGSPGGIPLASSDMVFAIVCEELGMIGALALLVFFIVIWLRSARITVIAGDGFTSSLALAAGTMFFAEAAVVIAGVTGLIPLTGVTLPFISEGGSSLLAKIILMSVLIGLSARRTEQRI